ncbi:hypothetical protein CEK28_16715 [Xenophilus sp. AP218F]|nr:EAL domain-containing protein [Chromobacterium sp. ASV5]OWY37485.1 hypothetical protein CEK28_16715 [Xenophilus sp. AP218F]
MKQLIRRWMGGLGRPARPGQVYAACLALCLLPALLLLCLGSLWSGRAELLERGQALAGQVEPPLRAGFAALQRVQRVPLGGRGCDLARARLASIVQQTPYARYAYKQQEGLPACTSDEARADRPLGDQSLSLVLDEGRGPALALAEPGADHAVLELGTEWLQALLAQAGSGGVAASVQVGARALAADGSVRLHEEDRPDAAIALQTLPVPVAVQLRRPWWREVGAGVAGHLEALLLAAMLGGGLGWSLLRSRGARNAAGWEIEQGMRHDEFFIHYQPIVAAVSGECVGAEVLARWKHPAQGNVRAELFIPAAIDAGLIIPLTRHLLRKAAEELKSVALPPRFMLGVNVVAEHLASPQLPDDCRELLALLQAKQGVLVLEVSERSALRDDSGAPDVIAGLRRMGVRLALDDFGAGHADKAYLRKWGFDYLKVEKGYVSALGQDCLRGNILDGLLLSSGKMGAQVIVKGVETQGQQSYLNVKGFEYLQGFYFGKPMALNHFRQWLYSGILESRGGLSRRAGDVASR